MERSQAEGGVRPQNLVLSTLPASEFDRIQPHLRRRSMPSGLQLYPAGAPPTEVCFIDEGMVSLVTMLEDGNALEVAAVGAEGVVGAEMVLGGIAMSSVEVLGQVEGSFTAIGTSQLSAALPECPVLHARLVRHQSLLLLGAFQSAACASQHAIGGRLARWLLTVADRIGGEQFMLTQEFIAQMLGVQRSSVTIEARILAATQLIEYRRGNITITDRASLEEAACECYRVIEAQYQQFASGE